MRLVLLMIAAAVLTGLATGGRPTRLAELGVRLPLVAIAGIALQLLPASGVAGSVLLVGSLGLLLVAAIWNARRPGFPAILVGLALNFLVISLNGGMPVAERALVDSGQRGTLGELRRAGGAKHHLARPGDVLVLFADTIPIPPPVRQAVSPGDLLVYAGTFWFIVRGMRRPPGVGSSVHLADAGVAM